MNIVVCVKQVPDSSDIKINPETNTLVRSGVPSIINPFDESAIEEGLRLRDQLGGKVTVVSMGPPQVEDMLRDILAFGVDDVMLVTDRAFAGADTLATSYTLGRTIEKFLPDADLVIFGKQAIDGDTAQVGPGVAEYLKMPQMIYVIKVESVENSVITVRRELEDGYEVIKSKLPAAITVLKGINTLRMPSLKGKMKAKSATIRKITVADLDPDMDRLGLRGSPTWVSKIFTPPVKGNRRTIIDDGGSAGVAIADILKNLKVV